ncbi:MAG: hypothetical protein MK086_00050 [Flavobacteriales bacterium]|nr:hypothetical protein [Flavobacteriales bacterium]
MKKSIIFILLILPALVFGQREPKLTPEKRKEIEGMKIAYLTTEMDLSPSEAQVFWPVYNEFSDKREAHREEGKKRFKDYRKNKETLTDEEIMEHLEFKFKHERERIDLEEEYFKKFVKVLSPQKVQAMLEAEDGFKRKLLQQMRGERKERSRPE